MTVVRPDWAGANKPGPEIYAPRNRRAAPEKLSDLEQIAFLHRQQHETDPPNAPVVEKPNELIRRIAGASIEEIDRVIRELENVRDMLGAEGERLSREIARYASLSHASTTAMKVIADSIKQWNETPRRRS
ncbi:MAG: hypothetical protein WCC81_00845 [Pseudolabrys sp.]